MDIDIGGENKEVLKIREFDDPYIVADNFCKSNNLKPYFVSILEKSIKENL